MIVILLITIRFSLHYLLEQSLSLGFRLLREVLSSGNTDNNNNNTDSSKNSIPSQALEEIASVVPTVAKLFSTNQEKLKFELTHVLIFLLGIEVDTLLYNNYIAIIIHTITSFMH